jgi:hypothetical protein
LQKHNNSGKKSEPTSKRTKSRGPVRAKGLAVRRLVLYSLVSLLLFAVPAALQAQASTSREIKFDFVFSHLPFGSSQTITVQVWDAATGGNVIFSEGSPGREGGFLR